jgi:hypothetical protein
MVDLSNLWVTFVIMRHRLARRPSIRSDLPAVESKARPSRVLIHFKGYYDGIPS